MDRSAGMPANGPSFGPGGVPLSHSGVTEARQAAMMRLNGTALPLSIPLVFSTAPALPVAPGFGAGCDMGSAVGHGGLGPRPGHAAITPLGAALGLQGRPSRMNSARRGDSVTGIGLSLAIAPSPAQMDWTGPGFGPDGPSVGAHAGALGASAGAMAGRMSAHQAMMTGMGRPSYHAMWDGLGLGMGVGAGMGGSGLMPRQPSGQSLSGAIGLGGVPAPPRRQLGHPSLDFSLGLGLGNIFSPRAVPQLPTGVDRAPSESPPGMGMGHVAGLGMGQVAGKMHSSSILGMARSTTALSMGLGLMDGVSPPHSLPIGQPLVFGHIEHHQDNRMRSPRRAMRPKDYPRPSAEMVEQEDHRGGQAGMIVPHGGQACGGQGQAHGQGMMGQDQQGHRVMAIQAPHGMGQYYGQSAAPPFPGRSYMPHPRFNGQEGSAPGSPAPPMHQSQDGSSEQGSPRPEEGYAPMPQQGMPMGKHFGQAGGQYPSGQPEGHYGTRGGRRHGQSTGPLIGRPRKRGASAAGLDDATAMVSGPSSSSNGTSSTSSRSQGAAAALRAMPGVGGPEQAGNMARSDIVMPGSTSSPARPGPARGSGYGFGSPGSSAGAAALTNLQARPEGQGTVPYYGSPPRPQGMAAGQGMVFVSPERPAVSAGRPAKKAKRTPQGPSRPGSPVTSPLPMPAAMTRPSSPYLAGLVSGASTGGVGHSPGKWRAQSMDSIPGPAMGLLGPPSAMGQGFKSFRPGQGNTGAFGALSSATTASTGTGYGSATPSSGDLASAPADDMDEDEDMRGRVPRVRGRHAMALAPAVFHTAQAQAPFPYSAYELGDTGREAKGKADKGKDKDKDKEAQPPSSTQNRGCFVLLDASAEKPWTAIYRRIGAYTIELGEAAAQAHALSPAHGHTLTGTRAARLAMWSVRRLARNWSKEAMVRYPHRAGVVARRNREQGRFS